MYDKLSRIVSLIQGADNKVRDESIVDTLKDLANYAIMSVIELEKCKYYRAEDNWAFCLDCTNGVIDDGVASCAVNGNGSFEKTDESF